MTTVGPKNTKDQTRRNYRREETKVIKRGMEKVTRREGKGYDGVSKEKGDGREESLRKEYTQPHHSER